MMDNGLRLIDFTVEEWKLIIKAFYTQKFPFPSLDNKERWLSEIDIAKVSVFVGGDSDKEVVLNWCEHLLQREVICGRQ